MFTTFKDPVAKSGRPFLLLKKSPPIIAWSLLIIYTNFMASCSYYRVKDLDPGNKSVTRQIQKKKKYVILHTGDDVWHLTNIVVDHDGQMIRGIVEALPDNHLHYKTAKATPHANRYKPGHYADPSDQPVYELHIYTDQTTGGLPSEVSIPFSAIRKAEVYDVYNAVVSTVAVAAGMIVIMGIISVLTKSSCPFVYIADGNTYYFTGEMYGGAIYPSLERDDYMPLQNFQPVGGVYGIKISNELMEKQHTNLANLIVVEHAENSNAIIDKYGNIQTISNAQLPISARSGSNIDFKEKVAARDSSHFSFSEPNPENVAVSSLTMSFKRPENTKTAKLILHAKNSYWLDYVYGVFNEQFGILYNTFARQQRKEPAQKLNQWSREQHIPLAVYIETEEGWKFADHFNSIGPLASRDVVMPIDLTGATGDEIKIKIECGFMFWDVDYAAIDFSENVPFTKHLLKPASAIDENGKEVSDLLSAIDHKYLVQPKPGNFVKIDYKSPAVSDRHKQTVFLYSRGYYEYIRDYKGIPNISYLKSFEEKEAFTRFAKKRYDAFAIDRDFYTAVLTQRNEN